MRKALLLTSLIFLSGCTIFGPSTSEVVVVPTRSSNGVVTLQPAHNCTIVNRYKNRNEKDFKEIYTGNEKDSGMVNLYRSAELAGRNDGFVKKPFCRPKTNVIVKVP